jgi:hypothetical protein
MKPLQTLLLCAFLLAPLGCQANNITIAFSAPDQTGAPGATLEFDANIFNNTSSSIDLRFADIGLAGMFAMDSSPSFWGPRQSPRAAPRACPRSSPRPFRVRFQDRSLTANLRFWTPTVSSLEPPISRSDRRSPPP